MKQNYTTIKEPLYNLSAINIASIPLSVTISCGRASLKSEGYIHLDIKDNYEVDVVDLEQITATFGSLSNFEKAKVLITVGEFTTFSQDALRNSCNPNFFKYSLIEAYVLNSLHQRIVANFYLNIMKPPVPTKFFKSEEDAVRWLKNN